MAQLSPNTKRKFVHALTNSRGPCPQLPIDDEPDVFGHGTSLDD
jgi:hypothetical protein